MSANAIETLRGCVESCAAESGAEHEGVGEDALAAVETLLQAVKAKQAHENNMPVLLDDRTYEDWATENAMLGSAVAAAVRRVESGQ